MILKKDNIERIISATSIGIIDQLRKEGWSVVPEEPKKVKRKIRKEVSDGEGKGH